MALCLSFVSCANYFIDQPVLAFLFPFFICFFFVLANFGLHRLGEPEEKQILKIEYYDFLANGDLRVESARVLGIQNDVIELTLTDGSKEYEVSFPRADIEAMRTALI